MGLRHCVPDLQPAPIHLSEPGCPERLLADVEELLVLRMDRALSGLPAMLEGPVEFGNGRRVQR